MATVIGVVRAESGEFRSTTFTADSFVAYKGEGVLNLGAPGLPDIVLPPGAQAQDGLSTSNNRGNETRDFTTLNNNWSALVNHHVWKGTSRENQAPSVTYNSITSPLVTKGRLGWGQGDVRKFTCGRPMRIAPGTSGGFNVPGGDGDPWKIFPNLPWDGNLYPGQIVQFWWQPPEVFGETPVGVDGATLTPGIPPPEILIDPIADGPSPPNSAILTGGYEPLRNITVVPYQGNGLNGDWMMGRLNSPPQQGQPAMAGGFNQQAIGVALSDEEHPGSYFDPTVINSNGSVGRWVRHPYTNGETVPVLIKGIASVAVTGFTPRTFGVGAVGAAPSPPPGFDEAAGPGVFAISGGPTPYPAPGAVFYPGSIVLVDSSEVRRPGLNVDNPVLFGDTRWNIEDTNRANIPEFGGVNAINNNFGFQTQQGSSNLGGVILQSGATSGALANEAQPQPAWAPPARGAESMIPIGTLLEYHRNESLYQGAVLPGFAGDLIWDGVNGITFDSIPKREDGNYGGLLVGDWYVNTMGGQNNAPDDITNGRPCIDPSEQHNVTLNSQVPPTPIEDINREQTTIVNIYLGLMSNGPWG